MQDQIKSKASQIDRYVGHQVRMQRHLKLISDEQACSVLGLPTHKLAQYEEGRSRFAVSDIFSLKKEVGVELEPFFSYEGEYYSDVILDHTEMADVFHYFSNIEDPKTRLRLLALMKAASSVF